MEKSFTDNEIIKALECCSAPHCNNNKCPMYNNTINTKDCITKLSTNALDLVNRQRAEIEKLEKGSLKEAMTFNSKTIANIRVEAVKEFAERLKKEFNHNKTSITSLVTVFRTINNLLEEMEEET